MRSKKWWWPLFRVCVDLAKNNAFRKMLPELLLTNFFQGFNLETSPYMN